ncbi:unnamed protein product [Spirodela intermedia]|uniref:Uncharacterized protein n=1 Tax=Spirodela intermedia TaxID=51605 RepID=A0A7I8LAP1_SPIIN|nr:unnamed protein product [Spirodela intermedia]
MIHIEYWKKNSDHLLQASSLVSVPSAGGTYDGSSCTF